MKDFERITRLEGQVLSLTNKHNEMGNNLKELVGIQGKCVDEINELRDTFDFLKKELLEIKALLKEVRKIDRKHNESFSWLRKIWRS